MSNTTHLSNPLLSIKLKQGANYTAEVDATVVVTLSDPVKVLIKSGLQPRLRCRLRGRDSLFNGSDDHLYSFKSKTVTTDGKVSFGGTVSRDDLDEDPGEGDEVYARFSLHFDELFKDPPHKDSKAIEAGF